MEGLDRREESVEAGEVAKVSAVLHVDGGPRQFVPGEAQHHRREGE